MICVTSVDRITIKSVIGNPSRDVTGRLSVKRRSHRLSEECKQGLLSFDPSWSNFSIERNNSE